MKKLLYAALSLIICPLAVTSCGDDDTDWSDYKEWRDTNNSWYLEQQALKNPDGTPYYTELNPSWYPESGVLIHYFNDRTKTEGNLSPMLTSKVTVKYKGSLYNGMRFDSTAVAGADTVRTFSLQGVVTGWQIALSDMRVGDTCEIVLPYYMGYGSQSSGSIPPYSSLKFGIKLTDVQKYEIP